MSDPITGLRLEFEAARRARVGTEWNHPNVVSPFFRLYLVHAAEGATVAHGGRTWQLTPAEIHLIPAFARSDYRCLGLLDHSYLHISALTTAGLDLTQVLDLPGTIPTGPSHPARFARIITGLASPDPAARLVADAEVRLILADFAARSPGPAKPSDPLAELVIWLIDHLDQPLTVADLAARVDLRPSWFTERFRARHGLSPAVWIRERRLERAARLLGDGLRIETVAERCGWTDRGYFTRCFTRRFGCGPAAWRRRLQLSLDAEDRRG